MITLGYGRLACARVLAEVVPKDQLIEKGVEKESFLGKVLKKITRRQKGLVKVSGFADMLVSYAKCCSPVPGDPIVGFVTRGMGVKIHVRNCQRILAADPDRLVSVEWDISAGTGREARIRVICVDRPGLLSSITEAITKQNVNIIHAEIKTTDDKKAVNIFGIEIKGTEELRNVIRAIERVKGVISVERVKS